ncbi:MAG: hypothetical protein ISR64_04035 [Deltaproteobacteria bacterium]|nr:hypothetical protein [Deltaproteobacteria bacterium]
MLRGRETALTTVLAATLFTGAPVLASDTGPARDPCGNEACFLASARASLVSEEPGIAVATLKQGREAFPGSRDIQVLLGVAYQHAGNGFWAIRVLAGRVADHPGDCDARAWLAWVYIEQAALHLATEALAHEDCALGQGPDSARFLAVRSRLSLSGGDPDSAARDLKAARGLEQVWPEDREALRTLPSRIHPHRLLELTVRAETRYGYTTNALMGSGVDVAGEQKASDLFREDIWLRYAPDTGSLIRPVMEFQTRIVRYLQDGARELSTMDLTGRIGLVIGGPQAPRVTLTYRPDFLLLDRSDAYGSGPVWYFGAHRGDIEVEATDWLLVLAGAGRRTFRETARTRTEVDLGVGGGIPMKGPVSLLWGVTGRVHRARRAAYHVYGGTLLARVGFRLPLGFSIRTGLNFSVDYFPESMDYDRFDTGGDRNRRDFFVKATLEAWSPPLFPVWRGTTLKLGVSYDFSDRESTAANYDYMDHRVLLRLALTFSSDVELPGISPDLPVAPLPWAGGEAGGGFDDRIQDLLRQDEEVMRSSSCVQ